MKPKLVRDKTYPETWRILADGKLSDMVNRARAKHALRKLLDGETDD